MLYTSDPHPFGMSGMGERARYGRERGTEGGREGEGEREPVRDWERERERAREREREREEREIKRESQIDRGREIEGHCKSDGKIEREGALAVVNSPHLTPAQPPAPNY